MAGYHQARQSARHGSPLAALPRWRNGVVTSGALRGSRISPRICPTPVVNFSSKKASSGSQQHAVDRAENCRGGANAKRQREGGDRDEAFLLEKLTTGVGQILGEILEPRNAPLVTTPFRHLDRKS